MFYGYVIVSAASLIMLLTWGAVYSFGVFFKPMIAELGWTRAATSGAYSLIFVLAGCLGILGGRLSDRFGPRILVTVCSLLIASGYLLLSQVSELWHFYLFYGLVMAFGRIMIAMTPHTAIISNWFVKKRGTAMGLAAAGIGIGSILMVPLVQFGISHFGWRYGCTLMACLILLVQHFIRHKRQPSKNYLAKGLC